MILCLIIMGTISYLIGCITSIWTLNVYQKKVGKGWFPWPFKDLSKGEK
jgi:hypothetical protein